MKRKISIVLMTVMVLNLVANIAAMLPANIVLAENTQYTTPLVVDNFEGYTNAAEMQAVWTGNSTAVVRNLQSGGPTGSTKMLRSSGFNAANYAKSTFPMPVPLTAASGIASPGRNAKLVTEYYVNGVDYTSGNSCYWGITNSSMTNSNTTKYAVGVGTRGGDTTAALRYGSYIDSGFRGDLLLAGVGGDQSGGWHKVKFVINISDADGAYLSSGPIVEAYIDDGTTNALSANKGLLNSEVSFVDEFRVSGSHDTRVADTDNANIYLTYELAENETPAPTPVPDSSALQSLISQAGTLLTQAVQGDQEGQYSSAKIAALTAAKGEAETTLTDPNLTQVKINIQVAKLQTAINAFTPNTATPRPITTMAPDGTLYNNDFETTASIEDVQNIRNLTPSVYGIVDNGTTKYLRMSKGTGFSGPAFDIMFNPVKINSGSLPSGAENAVIPGAKKLISAEFDIRTNENATTSRTTHLSVSGKKSDGSVINLAMLYHYGKDSTAYYTYGKPSAAGGTPSTPTGFESKYAINPIASSRWYHIRYEIPVTDSASGFISGSKNVNVYVDGVLTPVQFAPFINGGSVIADRISIKECNYWSDSNSDTAEGFCIDNISVKLEDYDTLPTPPPTPTPTPTPTLETRVYYSENFEGYQDSASLIANSGWTASGTDLSLRMALATSATNPTNYLSANPSSGPVKVTFDPIVFKVSEPSQIKNAKLIAQYKIARAYTSTSSWHYFAFGDSAKFTNANNPAGAPLAVGHRPATYADLDPNMGQWLYQKNYQSNINSGSANIIKPGAFKDSENQWTKIKYVVKLTDENGVYVTPTVDVYVDDQTTPVKTGVALLDTSVNKIDGLFINCTGTKAYCIDDIEVKVISGDEPTIPADTITINGLNLGTGAGTEITDPYGKVGASLVRVDVTNQFDPIADNKVIKVKDTVARLTSINGVNKFVALVDGSVTTSDITIVEGTIPTQLIYGDVTLNGELDGTDVNYLKSTVNEFRVTTDYFEYIASDVNGDGEVNGTDVNVLKAFLLEITPTLPVYSK